MGEKGGVSGEPRHGEEGERGRAGREQGTRGENGARARMRHPQDGLRGRVGRGGRATDRCVVVRLSARDQTPSRLCEILVNCNRITSELRVHYSGPAGGALTLALHL